MRLLLGTACIALSVACAPTPSAQPLGWGPLTPGMRSDPAQAAHHTAPKPQKAPRVAAVSVPTPEEPTPKTETPPSDSSKPPSDGSAHKADAKGKAAPTTTAFLGDYSGDDVAVYHIENLPDRTEKDPKARLKVTSSSDTALAFELVDSSNGNEICTLNGTLTDSGATIAKGQKCFEQSAEDASTAATVLSGTASIDQARLVFDLDMSFAMDAGGRKLGGSLSYHFDGKRK